MEHGELKKEIPSDPKTWVRPVAPRRWHRYSDDPFAHLYGAGPMNPQEYQARGYGSMLGGSQARAQRAYDREYFG